MGRQRATLGFDGPLLLLYHSEDSEGRKVPRAVLGGEEHIHRSSEAHFDMDSHHAFGDIEDSSVAAHIGS